MGLQAEVLKLHEVHALARKVERRGRRWLGTLGGHEITKLLGMFRRARVRQAPLLEASRAVVTQKALAHVFTAKQAASVVRSLCDVGAADNAVMVPLLSNLARTLRTTEQHLRTPPTTAECASHYRLQVSCEEAMLHTTAQLLARQFYHTEFAEAVSEGVSVHNLAHSFRNKTLFTYSAVATCGHYILATLGKVRAQQWFSPADRSIVHAMLTRLSLPSAGGPATWPQTRSDDTSAGCIAHTGSNSVKHIVNLIDLLSQLDWDPQELRGHCRSLLGVHARMFTVHTVRVFCKVWAQVVAGVLSTADDTERDAVKAENNDVYATLGDVLNVVLAKSVFYAAPTQPFIDPSTPLSRALRQDVKDAFQTPSTEHIAFSDVFQLLSATFHPGAKDSAPFLSSVMQGVGALMIPWFTHASLLLKGSGAVSPGACQYVVFAEMTTAVSTEAFMSSSARLRQRLEETEAAFPAYLLEDHFQAGHVTMVHANVHLLGGRIPKGARGEDSVAPIAGSPSQKICLAVKPASLVEAAVLAKYLHKVVHNVGDILQAKGRGAVHDKDYGKDVLCGVETLLNGVACLVSSVAIQAESFVQQQGNVLPLSRYLCKLVHRVGLIQQHSVAVVRYMGGDVSGLSGLTVQKYLRRLCACINSVSVVFEAKKVPGGAYPSRDVYATPSQAIDLLSSLERVGGVPHLPVVSLMLLQLKQYHYSAKAHEALAQSAQPAANVDPLFALLVPKKEEKEKVAAVQPLAMTKLRTLHTLIALWDIEGQGWVEEEIKHHSGGVLCRSAYSLQRHLGQVGVHATPAVMEHCAQTLTHILNAHGEEDIHKRFSFFAKYATLRDVIASIHALTRFYAEDAEVHMPPSFSALLSHFLDYLLERERYLLEAWRGAVRDAFEVSSEPPFMVPTLPQMEERLGVQQKHRWDVAKLGIVMTVLSRLKSVKSAEENRAKTVAWLQAVLTKGLYTDSTAAAKVVDVVVTKAMLAKLLHEGPPHVLLYDGPVYSHVNIFYKAFVSTLRTTVRSLQCEGQASLFTHIVDIDTDPKMKNIYRSPHSLLSLSLRRRQTPDALRACPPRTLSLLPHTMLVATRAEVLDAQVVFVMELAWVVRQYTPLFEYFGERFAKRDDFVFPTVSLIHYTAVLSMIHSVLVRQTDVAERFFASEGARRMIHRVTSCARSFKEYTTKEGNVQPLPRAASTFVDVCADFCALCVRYSALQVMDAVQAVASFSWVCRPEGCSFFADVDAVFVGAVWEAGRRPTLLALALVGLHTQLSARRVVPDAFLRMAVPVLTASLLQVKYRLRVPLVIAVHAFHHHDTRFWSRVHIGNQHNVFASNPDAVSSILRDVAQWGSPVEKGPAVEAVYDTADARLEELL